MLMRALRTYIVPSIGSQLLDHRSDLNCLNHLDVSQLRATHPAELVPGGHDGVTVAAALLALG